VSLFSSSSKSNPKSGSTGAQTQEGEAISVNIIGGKYTTSDVIINNQTTDHGAIEGAFSLADDVLDFAETTASAAHLATQETLLSGERNLSTAAGLVESVSNNSLLSTRETLLTGERNLNSAIGLVEGLSNNSLISTREALLTGERGLNTAASLVEGISNNNLLAMRDALLTGERGLSTAAGLVAGVSNNSLISTREALLTGERMGADALDLAETAINESYLDVQSARLSGERILSTAAGAIEGTFNAALTGLQSAFTGARATVESTVNLAYLDTRESRLANERIFNTAISLANDDREFSQGLFETSLAEIGSLAEATAANNDERIKQIAVWGLASAVLVAVAPPVVKAIAEAF